MAGIVLHHSKIVYWPIAKNACTLFKKRIAELLGLPIDTTVHGAPFEWTKKGVPGYTNVCIVRHPLRRLYSLWKNKIDVNRTTSLDWLGGVDPNVFGRWPGKFWHGMTFDEFCKAVFSIPPYKADQHFAPQYIQVPNQALIYRYEDLYPILLMLFKKENGSIYEKEVNIREIYSEENLQNAIAYYNESFKRFNYDFY